ncbi:MAG: CoA transferase [Pseudomonadota bacterium]
MDRVLEVGGCAAGYAGRLFVHAGGDVVSNAVAAPAWASDLGMDAFLHADKRRIEVQDPALLAELAEHCDVVIVHVENAQAAQALGVMEWQGCVRVVITSFGLSGPKKDWRATPNVLLAMGGYTHLMGDADRAPLTLPGHYAEFQAGALAYAAANAARFCGENDVLIEISILETLMTLSQFTTVRWHCAGEVRGRHGSDFWYVEPSELYACADGWIYVNIVPQFWDPFTVFLDRPELAMDERFTTNDLRMQNRRVLHEIGRKAVADLTIDELAARAESCRVPVGIVRSLQEVLDEPHLGERSFWYQVELEERSVKVPRPNYRIGGMPGPDRQLFPVEYPKRKLQS